MLFTFYYRNSVDSFFKTLMWGGGGCKTYSGQHSNCDDPLLYFRIEFLNAITLGILPNRICFSFSMIFIKNVRKDANHFSNQTFVLFQDKFSQSRYEVRVILPVFLFIWKSIDLRIAADDASKIVKPRAAQSLTCLEGCLRPSRDSRLT